MMVWIFILAILVILVGFILLTPLIIHIDSERNEYMIIWKGIARVNVLPGAREILAIRISTPVYATTLYPFRPAHHRAETTVKHPAQKKQQHKRKMSHLPGRIVHIVKSFRVRECIIDIDTGDYQWNAWLYPVLWFLNRGNRHLHVNYVNRNIARIDLRNNLIKMIYAFIR